MRAQLDASEERVLVELGATGAESGLVEPAGGGRARASLGMRGVCVGRALGVNHVRCPPRTSVATCVTRSEHTFSLPAGAAPFHVIAQLPSFLPSLFSIPPTPAFRISGATSAHSIHPCSHRRRSLRLLSVQARAGDHEELRVSSRLVYPWALLVRKVFLSTTDTAGGSPSGLWVGPRMTHDGRWGQPKTLTPTAAYLH